ncbi:hypothetical protein GCM10010121_052670 [Streptomyces brasiliensis]|uniref:Uncharacterized protein n=1 Tax=Streptomyces brasiliensis TaxID=1954 RepID=A0A917NW99_9ACTN|nr:hypothetical protein GCM10010121_052670 [Streptomyces brasiliensis]
MNGAESATMKLLESYTDHPNQTDSVVISPPAFLALTTRLAIDVAQSSRRRRETPAGCPRLQTASSTPKRSEQPWL